MYGNKDRHDGGGFGQSFAPVKVGEELDVKIEAVGEKGDGIAKKKGFILFVPGVKEGEEVKIKVTKVLKKVGFAEVIGKADGKKQVESKKEEPPIEDSENFGEESEKPEESEESDDEDSEDDESDDEDSEDEEDSENFEK